ncbi:MAG: ASPIC/UnbV domain-containing protein [Planctomycetota bacterium]
MASTLAETDDKAVAASLQKKANIREQETGSQRYQADHMGLIFQEGLSFSGFERNKVFLGRAGMHYLDLSDVSGADSDMDCRATVVADFDDDGDPDLFVNAIQRETHLLYRNDVGSSQGNRSIKVRLRAKSGNLQAIGAIVKLRVDGRVQAQPVCCGSGFEAQDDLELIFGVGKAAQGTLTVRWPGGTEETFGSAQAGGRYLLVEGTGKLDSYAARTFTFGDPPIPGLNLKVGDSLPNLSLLALAGTAVELDLRSDSTVLLNFWSTTCASCIAELPQLQALAAAGKTRVVAINMDPPGRAPVAQKLWDSKKLTFPSYRIDARQLQKYFDVERLAIPVSIWVQGGKIVRIHQGQLPEDE